MEKSISAPYHVTAIASDPQRNVHLILRVRSGETRGSNPSGPRWVMCLFLRRRLIFSGRAVGCWRETDRLDVFARLQRGGSSAGEW